MQPKQQIYATVHRIAAKEVVLFFSSPIAYLFLATFAAVTLFVFFWGEAFFARNIADVRPLFEWMPILLIFLSSTLTMRMWSEERRSGTLEHVLTQPAPLWQFVVGKFAGCLVLLLIALIITLPLPITVSLIGELDWGPVWAGYLATFLLGAAYLSIGLFVSSRSDNQIVSLISAVALCGLFYLVGSPVITDLFGNQVGEWLRLLGTGSRFDSITRGVIDFRDLYYYLSIIAAFITLNTLSLERERWAKEQHSAYHRGWQWLTFLIVANALGANLWLGQIGVLRVDATRGDQYSISAATKSYLAQLQEPLLIRAYFSSKTHPLLAPLVPQLRDLIKEYEVAGHGKVKVEFVDPLTNPDVEEQANQKYGIKPVPFQVADRYQSSIVSSYFNVLVSYGDEYQVLGFKDLIEVKARGENDLDVELRNPEHDITRAIKKVLQSYQSGGNLFATIKGDVQFKAYVSAKSKLPQKLAAFRDDVERITQKVAKTSNGHFTAEFIDPQANNGAVADQIGKDYGFQPMATNLFSDQHFYFYLTLAKDGTVVQIPLDDLSAKSFERNLDSGIKRFASGFTKTVAFVPPADNTGYSPYGGSMTPQFSRLEKLLSADLNVEREDLSDGHVSGDADILLLLAPEDLTQQQLFAVDQFLMQGGTVVLATSPYSASLTNRSLSVKSQHSGLEAWLEHNGLTIENQLVMDPQNVAFPVPVTRNVNGFQLQEYRMLDYPWFIDVRRDGLDQHNPVTADLPQLTMAWSSPISVDKAKQGSRTITNLIESSADSWLSNSKDVMPRITRDGSPAFHPQGKQSSHLLGVVSAGRFDSYFAGKESPLLAENKDTAANKAAAATDKSAKAGAAKDAGKTIVSGVIKRSPESARIILFASNDFLRDQVIRMAGARDGSEYLNSLQLVANAVDWSLEDAGLLSIRARGHFNRTLPPMEHSTQLFWEYLNYGLALLALVAIAVWQRSRSRKRQKHYLQLLAN